MKKDPPDRTLYSIRRYVHISISFSMWRPHGYRLKDVENFNTMK